VSPDPHRRARLVGEAVPTRDGLAAVDPAVVGATVDLTIDGVARAKAAAAETVKDPVAAATIVHRVRVDR